MKWRLFRDEVGDFKTDMLWEYVTSECVFCGALVNHFKPVFTDKKVASAECPKCGKMGLFKKKS